MIVFGPVPSRRLGRSLGVNNIPAKICSYSCIYCQLGRTIKTSVEREAFYDPEQIFEDVVKRIREVKNNDEKIDYLSFVPDGEPTLDANLGKEIELLKTLEQPVAVLTNASLLWRGDVREELLKADLVSVKIDAISEGLWRKINRPHKSLKINEILDGIIEFSEEFNGKLITETMLIDGIDYSVELRKIAKFLSKIRLHKAYISIPTRPPAESWVKPADEKVINRAFNLFSQKIGADAVEYLIGYEGNAFAFTGNIEEDLLSITSVHPMREEAVKRFLKRANAQWGIINKLLEKGELIELEYEGYKYYMRKIPSRAKA
ncbi:radical SAM protein [Candidatus Bathyarchaeota archaeon]|nr:MAG: radical SAM protein [Candidatus Bathyarchaeota archaeon]